MNRRLTAIGALIAVAALIAAACTPPTGPAPTTWKVKPHSIEVIDQEDWDPGDEPYVIQMGFRSKYGKPNTSMSFVASQCPWSIPATDTATPGSTYAIPDGAAAITFPEVQNLDIGDVLFNLAPLEIFGTLTIAMERDVVLGSCEWTEVFRSMQPLINQVLNAALGTPQNAVSEEELINILVANISTFLNTAAHLIGTQLEGMFTSPDDLLGLAIQIHLPTKGTFTDLLNLGLTLAGISNGQIPVDGLPENMKVRIGHLLPSSATFDFDQPGYHYKLKTVITR
jgi:hypothetical protein